MTPQFPMLEKNAEKLNMTKLRVFYSLLSVIIMTAAKMFHFRHQALFMEMFCYNYVLLYRLYYIQEVRFTLYGILNI